MNAVYRFVRMMSPGSPKSGVFVTNPRYSARTSKLGLSSYATPTPNSPPRFVFRLVENWFVWKSRSGENSNAPTPPSANGLKF